MLFRNLMKQSPKRERGEQKSKYYFKFQGAVFLYKNKFKLRKILLPFPHLWPWSEMHKVSLLWVTHTDHRSSLSLLNSFSLTSSGELLLYSLPHSSFLPFLYWFTDCLWGSMMRKTRNSSSLLSLKAEQILTSKYSVSCTGLHLLQSLTQLILRSPKAEWLFLFQNSRGWEDKINHKDQIGKIIFKYFFSLNLDTWEERNWITIFPK